MTSEPLDAYGKVYAKLLDLAGETVDVAISGFDLRPPLLAYTDGELEIHGDVYAPAEMREAIGLDRDALSLSVGGLALTLHPNHFEGATWTEDDRTRVLEIVFGSVKVGFRTGPRPREPET